MQEMIYKRKSVRKYQPESVDEGTLGKIADFCSQLKPLYDDIKVRAEIIGKDNVKCILPWIPPHAVAIFSEAKEGYWENAGFMFQQLDLYLQKIGLGTCWLGMGRLDAYAENDKDDLQFVILLAFGYPKEELRSDSSQFRRKSLGDIADRVDERLEPARLAPSSVNSQPWYFTHAGQKIHTYCVKQGMFKMKEMRNMNRIDIGIALAHMYVANTDTFSFIKEESVPEIKNYGYIGSFSI